jgi:GR25 family glycosyltransferase involved in LPS biosynthesis
MINYLIILLLLSLIIYLILHKNETFEFFSDELTFDIYAISLGNPDRIKNVEEQQKKLDTKIKVFDAVVGDKLDVNVLIKQKLLIEPNFFNNNVTKKKREIGCYLSHYRIYEKIKEDNKKGYTIVFEDDFQISNENLIKNIQQTIVELNEKQMDFDILYLGNLENNHGINVLDNLYDIDLTQNLYGTYAYMINNKNIDKIINGTKTLECPIDNRLQDLGKTKKIISYLYYPTQVNPWGGNGSTITENFRETFSNKFSIFD